MLTVNPIEAFLGHAEGNYDVNVVPAFYIAKRLHHPITGFLVVFDKISNFKKFAALVPDVVQPGLRIGLLNVT